MKDNSKAKKIFGGGIPFFFQMEKLKKLLVLKNMWKNI